MDQELLTPLNQLETSLNSLLTSLTNTNTYAAAPAATQSLLDADDALSSALIQLKQHQENYARILTLRAEADSLRTQLRDIVRTCVDLRSEISRIHPSILEDTDDEDDDDEDTRTTTSPALLKRKNEPVDYDTLLSFAARIGKHNAAASLEAERQSNKRDAESEHPNPQDANGNGNGNGNATQTGDSVIADDVAGSNNATQESLAELAAINDTLAQQRAFRGMAFPAAEALRMGVLGRLQYLREQEGEEAVEREIERMVRESERVTGPEVQAEKVEEVKDVKIESVSSKVERPAYASQPQSLRPAPPQAQLPPKPKVALDLDFPGSDEDDDDD